MYKCIKLKERNLTQVLNNSVSLNNLDISPNSTLINHVKTKEISTSINHATETTVLPISINNTNHSKHSTTSGVELIIENIKPDPVWNYLKYLYIYICYVILINLIYIR